MLQEEANWTELTSRKYGVSRVVSGARAPGPEGKRGGREEAWKLASNDEKD